MLKENTQITMDDFSQFEGIYDILVTKDNIWRQIDELVDFSFVYDILKDSYSSTMGRTAQDVVRMFKYLLLKQYYRLSDVGLLERTLTDLSFKYFLGYKPEETKLIDPSLLTVFRRERIAKYETDEKGNKVKVKDSSKEVMNQLLAKTIEIALEKGILSKKIKIVVDATHTNARFSHISPRQELINESRKLRKAVYEVDASMHTKMPKKRESTGLLEDEITYVKELIEVVEGDGRFTVLPDTKEKISYLKEVIEDTETELEYSKEQDAKIGHKTADTSFFGFKTHIAMDEESRIITGATITSGEKHDGKELTTLIENTIAAGLEVEAIIGDGAYSEEENLVYCKENNIKNISKLSKSVLYGNRAKEDAFEFNKDAGMFVCKAGNMAIRKAHSKGNKHNNNSEVDTYFFDVEKCKHCPLKEGCYKEGAKSKSYSVTVKKEIHNDQKEYMETEEFKALYKERYKIEAKNAELKMGHGYGQANACGIGGMTIQGATALFLVNMKRILKLTGENKG